MTIFLTKILRVSIFAVIILIAMVGSSNAKEENIKYKTAYIAGGCFWCMESDYEKIEGIKEVFSGYMGGHTKNPTYEQSSSGKTGHREAVKIVYNSNKISYKNIVDKFWHLIDMFDEEGQFCDKGFQYSSAIFVTSKDQRKIAEESKKKAQKSFKEKIVTPIINENVFYNAEGYHQDYYKHNPVRYKYYRYNCGRDQRIKNIWADIDSK